MKNSFIGAALASTVCIALTACGGVDLWPLGKDKFQERPRVPANATAYQCNGSKRFYVRPLDEGGAVWLILADREVRLAKIADTRYSNGIAVLEINGSEATLADGSANLFSGCKVATPSEK